MDPASPPARRSAEPEPAKPGSGSAPKGLVRPQPAQAGVLTIRPFDLDRIGRTGWTPSEERTAFDRSGTSARFRPTPLRAEPPWRPAGNPGAGLAERRQRHPPGLCTVERHGQPRLTSSWNDQLLADLYFLG